MCRRWPSLDHDRSLVATHEVVVCEFTQEPPPKPAIQPPAHETEVRPLLPQKVRFSMWWVLAATPVARAAATVTRALRSIVI